MNLHERWARTDMRSLDQVSNLLLFMADEIDRLGNEVLLLHNRTGDWSKGRAEHGDRALGSASRPLAGDNGGYK